MGAYDYGVFEEEPVVGYREWVLIGGELLSPLARSPWSGEPMQAECLPRCRGARGLWRKSAAHPGPAPDPACVCGLYAFFTPQRPRGRERLAVVRGAVVLWGRIELHERGMRAEFARIALLALPGSRPRGAEEAIARGRGAARGGRGAGEAARRCGAGLRSSARAVAHPDRDLSPHRVTTTPSGAP